MTICRLILGVCPVGRYVFEIVECSVAICLPGINGILTCRYFFCIPPVMPIYARPRTTECCSGTHIFKKSFFRF